MFVSSKYGAAGDRRGRAITLVATAVLAWVFAALFAILSGTGVPARAAAGDPSAAARKDVPKVALADFVILNDAGEFVPRTDATNPDLARLARVVPQGLAARLIQSEDYDVFELGPTRPAFTGHLDDDVHIVPPSVARWLEEGIADEVITGTAGMLQTSVVMSAQRYGWRDGSPALLGAATATAPRISDALPLADALIEDLYPGDAEIITKPIDQMFIVPSTIRIPIGRQRQLQAFAVDALGRPLTKVQFLYQSSDVSQVQVDETGVITAISPGQANVTVRAMGHPSRIVPTATATVQVVPPSFGIRAGLVPAGEGVQLGKNYRFGLRLTPTVDLRPRGGAQRQTPEDLTTAATNPLTYLTNLFSSLLSDGLFTIEMDFEPNETMLFTLDAIQRTRGGFFGTGIGFAAPLRTGGTQGVNLRITLGTQANLFGRTTLPIEVNTDVIFGTGDMMGTQVRVGVATGFDLFQ